MQNNECNSIEEVRENIDSIILVPIVPDGNAYKNYNPRYKLPS